MVYIIAKMYEVVQDYHTDIPYPHSLFHMDPPMRVFDVRFSNNSIREPYLGFRAVRPQSQGIH